jgi:hypothetical protein
MPINCSALCYLINYSEYSHQRLVVVGTRHSGLYIRYYLI